MPQYFFKCEKCRELVELSFPMGDSEGRKNALCPDCGDGLVRDFNAEARTKQFPKRIFFARYSASDFLPPEVVGAGPNSEAHRKFARETTGMREI